MADFAEGIDRARKQLREVNTFILAGGDEYTGEVEAVAVVSQYVKADDVWQSWEGPRLSHYLVIAEGVNLPSYGPCVLLTGLDEQMRLEDLDNSGTKLTNLQVIDTTTVAEGMEAYSGRNFEWSIVHRP